MVSPEDACLLKWGLLGNQLFVSAVDRFGRLDTAPWVRAIASWGRPVKVNSSVRATRETVEAADAVAGHRRATFAVGGV